MALFNPLKCSKKRILDSLVMGKRKKLHNLKIWKTWSYIGTFFLLSQKRFRKLFLFLMNSIKAEPHIWKEKILGQQKCFKKWERYPKMHFLWLFQRAYFYILQKWQETLCKVLLRLFFKKHDWRLQSKSARLKTLRLNDKAETEDF